MQFFELLEDFQRNLNIVFSEDKSDKMEANWFFMRGVKPEQIAAMVDKAARIVASQGGERIAVFRERLRAMTPELTGNDLKHMGISPGPQYREILTQLRDARLDGIITTRAEEEAWVRNRKTDA